VWAIFDTCHSGTITRGIEDEAVRYRDVKPADLGIVPSAIAKAEQVAGAALSRPRGSAEPKAPMTALQHGKPGPGAGGFVAFYAAQSWERAPEQPMPAHLSAGDPQKRVHGVFTYSISEALAMNPAMTYQQLAEQILHRYRGQARLQPTPLFEGPGLGARVFGSGVAVSMLQWRIEKGEGGLRIAAGALHRLASGALFAVYANPADADKAAIGRLEASKVELLHSTLVPVTRGGRSSVDLSLPADAYARLLDANSSLALRVSLPPPTPGAAGEGTMRVLLERLSKDSVDGLAVTWLPSRDAGEIRLMLRGGHLWFLPPSAEIREEEPNKTISVALAGKTEQQARAAVIETLRGIARASSLIKLASLAAGTAAAQGMEISMRYERQGKAFEFKPSQVPQLRPGDKLIMAVHNRLAGPADLNVLFVDGRYGIDHLLAQRFEPGGRQAIEVGTISIEKTAGRESMLVIVSEAEAATMPADFGFLSQPTLAATRGGDDDVRTLLETAGFGQARTRSLERPHQAVRKTGFRVFTWNTVVK
jgi:hypothetical protein